MMSRLYKNRIFAGFAIGFVITVISIVGILTGTFQNLHSQFSDNLFTIEDPSSEIVIIAIDDKSTQQAPYGLGRFSQWSRERFTEMLGVLQDEAPNVITFDLIFHTRTEMIPREKLQILEEEVENSANNKEKLQLHNEFLEKYNSLFDNPIDKELAEKLSEFDNVVLAGVVNYDGESLLKPIYEFEKNATVGLANASLDEKGVLREIEPSFYVKSEDKNYDNLAVATVKKYSKDILGPSPRLTEEIMQENKMIVNYFGEPYSYKMVSFVDVLNGQFEEGVFEDKIVLIGATSSKDIHDEYLTPKSNETPMAGVEIHANTIQTILDGKFLVDQSGVSQVLTVAGIAMALTIALNYLGIILSIILTIVVLFLYLAAAHVFYKNGIIVNMVYPFVAIVLAYVGSWVYKYFIADKDKREMKSAFSHYVSDKLVEEISKNPEIVKLGGEKRVVTVFFSDIKNSTQISEKTEITSWVSQLNEYFTTMEYVIQKCEGTIDKFEGDAIMGFFNAPMLQENHVILSFITALEMKKMLSLLCRKWQKEGKPLLEFRVGINTGEAIVGNFGSKNRFDYTAMGDTVNTASRLESAANKTYGTSVIAAGFENFAKPEMLGKVVMREIDAVLLPGKTEAVRIYELLCLAEEITPEIRTLITNYTNGLAAYRKKAWQTAIEAFKLLPNDNASQVMLRRCEKLIAGEMVEGLNENMVYRIFNK